MTDLKLVQLDQSLWDLIKDYDHKTLAKWAGDTALKTVHFYEEIYADDKSLRDGINALELWIKGEMPVNNVRQTVLKKVLPAARKAREDKNYVAEAAARAVAQATATAHVPKHCLGACIYALTAIKRDYVQKHQNPKSIIETEHDKQLQDLNKLVQTQ